MSQPGRLLDAAPGDLIVDSVPIDAAPRRRLAELGVRPGAAVTVVRRTSGGGIVVGAHGSRIALDRSTAAAITVRST